MNQFGEPCFAENLQLFANAQTQPEKFNHYNGLKSMAQGLQALSQEVYRLRQQLDEANQKLASLSYR